MDFIWAVYLLFGTFFVYVFLQWRIKSKQLIAYGRIPQTFPQQQEQNAFNISSRVQAQEQQRQDAFVSLDHITITNELNKAPRYDDAPPSYEEAIKIAMAQDNSLQTLRTEQAQTQGSSSTSTVTVVPAVPNRTTE